MMVRLRAEIRISYASSAGFARLHKGLTDLLEPGTLERLIAAAMQDSFVQAYARRFERAMEIARALQVESRDPLKVRRIEGELEELLIDKIQRLDQERAQTSSSKKRESLTNEIDKLSRLSFQTSERIQDRGDTATALGTGVERVGALQGLDGTEDKLWLYRRQVGPLKGQFSAALKKLQALFVPEQIQVLPGADGQISLGFVSIPRMDQIKTPSASPVTKSKMNVLWRHVEFGTGLLRKASPDGIRNLADHQAGGGAWWYPRSKRNKYPGPLNVIGSFPGNFVRTAAGLPFDTDALLFFPALAARIRRTLNQ